jgi:rod shape determining protein RodA
MNKILLYLKKLDWILFFSVALLMSFGLVEIYSIALSHGGDNLDNFHKQILFVVIGIVITLGLCFIDFNNYSSFGNLLYAFGFLLLLGVLFFGKVVRGTRGWYDIFGAMSLQPVEFAKIILIIFLAKYFSSNNIHVSPLKHLAITGISTLGFVLLVLKQPDFGSALLLLAIWVAMLMFSGFKKKYILLLVIAGLMLFSSAWFFFFKDYQKERIMTFLHPDTGSLEEGYNIKQATIAIGAGGLIGRGVGFGSQSQLKFLPESQNDFIFAVISEELGFLGVCLVLGFFSIFYLRLIKSAHNSNNNFGIYFLLGSGALIFIEMFINIGMNIGLLPVVGISLPFLSYGGSAIMASMILMGISQNIIIQSKIKY